MSLPLVFHPAVQDEISSAYDWYEQQRPGLGREFLERLEAAFGKIAANPQQYGFADRDIREGLLKRFPNAVYFRVLDDRIRVLAVFHAARDPSRWQSRN